MTQSDDQIRELERLRLRLQEAEETLEAIRSGQVDALVVTAPEGDQIFVLKSADQPYRLLVEQMREGAATLSPEGTLLFCNSYLAGMLNLPLTRVIGVSLQHFVAPEDTPVFQGLLRAALTGFSQGELRLLDADGQEVPAHLALSAFQVEGQPAVTLVATDLTEQKRNQEIIAAQRLARSILDQASDAIVTCDMAGSIIGANHAALGLAHVNPMGLRFAQAFPLTASQTAGEADSPLEVVGPALAGRNAGALEARLGRPDDAPVELLVAATSLLDTNGGQLGCVVTMTDITERKRAEAAERSARAAAEAAAERLARLQTATAEFSAAQSTAEVVAVVTRQSSAALHCDATLVELLSPDGQYLEAAAFVGPSAAPSVSVPGYRRPLAAAGVAVQVIQAGTPLWLQAQPGLAAHFPDYAAEPAPDFAAVVCLPLQHRGERLGLIRFGFLAAREFEAGERQFMLALAGQCAQALERARLYEAERQARLTLEERVLDRTRQLRALGERLETLREEERLRISREIHDQLGGQLTGLKIDISQIHKRLPEVSPELHEKISALSGAVDAIVQVVRRIASDLRPGLLDDFGLAAAVEWELRQFQLRTEIPCHLAQPAHEIVLSPEQATAVFRVFQEALTNVMRHAHATKVEITLTEAKDELVLVIHDDGIGLGTGTLSNATSLGLLGMQERMRQVGGRVNIKSPAQRGTSVVIHLPRTAAT